jgi:hypothetical protein
MGTSTSPTRRWIWKDRSDGSWSYFQKEDFQLWATSAQVRQLVDGTFSIQLSLLHYSFSYNKLASHLIHQLVDQDKSVFAKLAFMNTLQEQPDTELKLYKEACLFFLVCIPKNFRVNYSIRPTLRPSWHGAGSDLIV